MKPHRTTPHPTPSHLTASPQVLMQKLRALDTSNKSSLSRAEFIEGACTSTELLRVLCPDTKTSLASSHASDGTTTPSAAGVAVDAASDEREPDASTSMEGGDISIVANDNHFGGNFGTLAGTANRTGSSDMVLGGVPPSPSPLDGGRQRPSAAGEMV